MPMRQLQSHRPPLPRGASRPVPCTRDRTSCARKTATARPPTSSGFIQHDHPTIHPRARLRVSAQVIEGDARLDQYCRLPHA